MIGLHPDIGAEDAGLGTSRRCPSPRRAAEATRRIDRPAAPRRTLRGLVVQSGAVIGLWAIMAMLGLFFVTRARDVAMETQAISGSLYIEGFLAPHARLFLAGSGLSKVSRAELMAALEQPPVKNRIFAFRLWSLDGEMVFNSVGTSREDGRLHKGLATAFSGNVEVDIHTEGVFDDPALAGRPVVEIHAPIYDAAHESVIAVGEIYENATAFLKQRAETEYAIWLAVGLSTIGLTGVLRPLSAQRVELIRTLAGSRANSDQY